MGTQRTKMIRRLKHLPCEERLGLGLFALKNDNKGGMMEVCKVKVCRENGNRSPSSQNPVT